MIHQYKNNGYNIVLDVNSGSVHVVDDVVYDLIPIVEAALREGTTEPERMVAKAVDESAYEEEVCRETVSEILELKDKTINLNLPEKVKNKLSGLV